MLRTLQQIGGREALEDYFDAQPGVEQFVHQRAALDVPDQPLASRRASRRYGQGPALRHRHPAKGSASGAPGIVAGGWANSIPTGVKAPHEAWLLTQYLSATKEGGGWFMQEQVRPSPIKAVNKSPVYNDLPHWNVIKQALAPTC